MTTPVTSTVDLPMGLTLEPDYLTVHCRFTQEMYVF
jgi:hypothetical protein